MPDLCDKTEVVFILIKIIAKCRQNICWRQHLANNALFVHPMLVSCPSLVLKVFSKYLSEIPKPSNCLNSTKAVNVFARPFPKLPLTSTPPAQFIIRRSSPAGRSRVYAIRNYVKVQSIVIQDFPWWNNLECELFEFSWCSFTYSERFSRQRRQAFQVNRRIL